MPERMVQTRIPPRIAAMINPIIINIPTIVGMTIPNIHKNFAVPLITAISFEPSMMAPQTIMAIGEIRDKRRNTTAITDPITIAIKVSLFAIQLEMSLDLIGEKIGKFGLDTYNSLRTPKR